MENLSGAVDEDGRTLKNAGNGDMTHGGQNNGGNIMTTTNHTRDGYTAILPRRRHDCHLVMDFNVCFQIYKTI